MGLINWQKKDYLNFIDKVSTDSSTITIDTLPPNFQQIYINGSFISLFFNINNSICFTNLTFK